MINAKKRFKVLERDGFRCQYCGKNGKDVTLEVDHIIPKSKGGKDDLKNLITCCRECNIGKGSEITGDTKGVIRIKIKDKETEIVKQFFELRNQYGLGTIDNRNLAYVSGFIKSKFDWETVVGYVEQCLVGKIGRVQPKGKFELKDFYEGEENCDLAINERGTFVWENDICDIIIWTKKDEDEDFGKRLTDDYNQRLNWLISRNITWTGKPMPLLFKYSLFPNMVETWQKEKEEW